MRLVSRYGLLGLALVGCVLLVVAEFLDLYAIKVITVVKETGTVGGHHSYALAIIAVGAAAMAVGAVRGGSRPAAFALLVLAGASLFVALVIDLPDVSKTGLTELYEQAEAEPRSGFYLETLGAVVLLFAAVGILVLGGRPAEPQGVGDSSG